MMRINSGSDIVVELKRGNTRALHVLFDLHYPSLCHFAGGMLDDSPAAQDIVSEVFIVFWKKHTDFDSLHNVKAFLYISTRNACLNHLKKSQRDLALKNGLIRQYDGVEQEIALNRMIRAEAMKRVYEAIETLPFHCRNVFKMCYLEGCSNIEIAERLDISVHTVKNHKVRALRRIRATCRLILSQV